LNSPGNVFYLSCPLLVRQNAPSFSMKRSGALILRQKQYQLTIVYDITKKSDIHKTESSWEIIY
jgi:hypothetical protein